MHTPTDIAIIGMAGRFPGARSIGEFWDNLRNGVESIARLSDEEILASGTPAAHLRNPRYVRAAPVLDEPGHFDAAFFGISPADAAAMDPQHRLLLELAYEALEHAGCDPDRVGGRIGVFAGAALNTYYTSAGLSGRIAADYIPTLIGNDKDFLSTRISYKLNLRGPSLSVQTACSTALVAVHLARQSLLTRESDVALAGAVCVRVPHRAGYFQDGSITSPDGHVRAFDAGANGTVFGSGGGVLVLRRLSDALDAGDTVHAVIKGSAVNNDGSVKAGYTAPGVGSQADVVVEALANAGITADSIGYIEAHGTGTPMGDPIEMAALTKAFRAHTRRERFCGIGSVKTNVGHLDVAAGVASLIKTVLALKHRQLPASLNFSSPNPSIDFAHGPFFVTTELQDWASDSPRRAGVMATGMGGTNAHVILEEAPPRAAASTTDGPHLLVVSAKSAPALERMTDRLTQFLEANESANLGDVAHTLQTGRRAFPHRAYFVCGDREDAARLRSQPSPRTAFSRSPDTKRPVILLLPGVGDHYVGMGFGLYERWPVFREEVDRCARVLQRFLGIDVRSVLYPASKSWQHNVGRPGIDLKRMLAPGTPETTDPDAARLNRTAFAQPALFTVEYATCRLWQSLGITPDAIVGHSMGEYVAAVLAGVMSLEDALRIVAVRASLADALPPAAMLAVTLSEHELAPLVPEGLSICLINGPRLCIVAGPPRQVGEFERFLDQRAVICRHVQNGHAFHSRTLDSIVPALEAEVRRVRLHPPTVPYISNVSGTWVTPDEATNPAYWAQHAVRPARINDALRVLWEYPDPLLLESGPGRTISVLAMQHPSRPKDADPAVVRSLRHSYENEPDAAFFANGIGRAWTAGARISWDNIPANGPRRRVALPTYPFERQLHWIAPADGGVADPDVADAAAPARDARVQKQPNMDDWLYVPSWRRALPTAVSVADARRRRGHARTWLVFDDNVGFSNRVVDRLEAARQVVVRVKAGTGFERTDAHHFTVEPGNARSHQQLVEALQSARLLPDGILHAWSITSELLAPSERDHFETALDLGFYSLLFLTRALAAHNVRHDMSLFALSSSVYDVSGAEPLNPDKSTVLGPCLVIGQEYPNIRVKSIDVENAARREEQEQAAALVTGEILDLEPSPAVAYRQSQRWVQSYERVAPGCSRGREPSFREGGVYLITGGTGRIGAAIAEYLATRYQARLVLAGRSRPPDERFVARIREAGGDVLYLSANVADYPEMRRVVAETYRRFGDLHGVIHGAGVVGDLGYREITDADREHCDAHFQAKAHGVRVLDAVLHARPLDFCLLLSSLASVLGGIGQAAYASSNIYMDAFARAHNRRSRVPWLSVNWDVWRFEDAAAGTPFGAAGGATLRELGLNSKEGPAMLEAVLSLRPASQLVVSTGELGARIRQWVSGSTPAEPGVQSPRHETAVAHSRALRSTGDAPRDETEQRIAQIWQDALGVSEIGINDNFAVLGGHSLQAVKIVAELRAVFQLDLPVRAMFDTPTVAELADSIKAQLVAVIDALTDEEAQRFVSNT